MTILERQSLRKKKSIVYLVNNHEYSLGYALLKVEELYDGGKLTDEDYEYLANWIEELLEQEESPIEETPVEEIEEESTPEETDPEEGEE